LGDILSVTAFFNESTQHYLDMVSNFFLKTLCYYSCGSSYYRHSHTFYISDSFYFCIYGCSSNDNDDRKRTDMQFIWWEFYCTCVRIYVYGNHYPLSC
jgi:hypothetical protein